MNRNLFLFLILFAVARSDEEEEEESAHYHPLVPDHADLMCLFGALFIGVVLRLYFLKYSIPIPTALFTISIGFLWGIAVHYNHIIRLSSQVIYTNAQGVKYLFLALLIFRIAFCIDVPVFLKTLPQVAVIGIPVALTTGLIFGALMRLITDYEWTPGLGTLFGIFCSVIYPAGVVTFLKHQSTRTKQISALLEGEAILSLITADAASAIIMANLQGLVVKWYQFVACLLRFLVVGGVEGFLFGFFIRFLIRKLYTDRLSVFVLSFVIPFSVYSISQRYLSGCGAISVAIVGVMMSEERTVLPRDVDQFLTDLWEGTAFAVDTAICCTLGTLYSHTIAPHMDVGDYIVSIVGYVTYFAIRFVSFLTYAPILSRLGYGMDVKSMAVCVWGGVKSPISLVLCRLFMVKSAQVGNYQSFYFHVMGLYFYSLLINGTLTRTFLEFLGMLQISMARQINMSNCIKHILAQRDCMIQVLKMDRFLADTNFSLVEGATTIKNPYHLILDENDQDEFFAGYRFTTCPDCKKDVRNQPTAKELRDMTKEAKMRVLKAKKMSYSRQFQNGMMSKEGIRILTQAVELAMDSDEAVIELESLAKRFTHEGWLERKVRNEVQNLKKSKRSEFRRPRRYLRRVFYDIVVNNTWERFMLAIVAFHLIVMILDRTYHPVFFNGGEFRVYHADVPLDYFIVISQIVLVTLYIAEFLMKIFAYSWLHIWKHGVRTYFKSVWRIIDFVVMISCTLDALYAMSTMFSFHWAGDEDLRFRQVLGFFEMWRAIRLLFAIELFYPKILRYLDRNVDSEMAITYELGKSYATGETEILDMLPYMIDDKVTREEVKQKIESDRILITKLLGTVQKEKPWIAITVKTKQAIRTILNTMSGAITELKNLGWVDKYELEQLEGGMVQLYKKVNALKTIQPSAPKVIFKEVAWMADDENVISFLFENVTVKKFEPGEVVFGEGNVADGIYIVVTGLFKIAYTPDKNIVSSLREYGKLPIVDYLSGDKYDETYVDYIVSGNCIGELSTLTLRSYNCTITADAHCQVYVLSHNVLTRAMELSPDPVIGLECRIWKEVSVRIAVPILLSVPAYQSFQQDQIKYALERAFVPNLSNYKIFAVTDMIQDVVLVDGLVADYSTRELYVAPCCIPRTVQKLILPTSSLMNIPIKVETKLLIIPEKDVDEYDVMMTAEETCEMISTGASAKCLHHTVRNRARQRKRRKRVATSRKDPRKVSTEQLVTDSGTEYFRSTRQEASSYDMGQRSKHKWSADNDRS